MNQKTFEFVRKYTPAEVFEIGNKALKEHPEFFRFLKESGVYDKWMKNRCEFILNFCSEIYPYLQFADISGHERIGGYLLSHFQSSFSWDETPEGFKFWDKMNDKWLKAAAKLDKKTMDGQ